MKITIISGSHRNPSQSRKVADTIEKALIEQRICEETWLLDLGDHPLPLWDQSIFEGATDWKERLAPIREQLKTTDGFVVISPEWSGMAPSGLKNFFLMWGRGGEVAHKPALLVGVSADEGGAYPLAELRMSSYKNNRICYVPEQLIVRNVETVFNENPADNDQETDVALRERLAYALRILGEYTKAFRQIRASGACDLSVYSSGM